MIEASESEAPQASTTFALEQSAADNLAMDDLDALIAKLQSGAVVFDLERTRWGGLRLVLHYVLHYGCDHGL